MKKVVIYGTSNMARILYEDFKLEKQITIAGFTTDKEYIKTDTFCNLPLCCIDQVNKIYDPNEYDMIVVFSHRFMRVRKTNFDKAKSKGYRLINYVSSGAKIMSEIKGENNIILSNVYMGPFGKIGNDNIIRYNTYIGHDFDIGSHNYVSPGCNIGGQSTVEDLCFIGIGSTIKDKIIVRNETLLGAGSVLVRDTDEFSAYIGNPAKKIKEHKEQGIIL